MQIFRSIGNVLSRAETQINSRKAEFIWMALLTTILFIHHDSWVWAQIREDTAVFLAPALEVFLGNGTGEETYYIWIIIIAASLLAAIVAANVAYFTRLLTFKLLVRIFGVWILVAAGLSAMALSNYVGTREQNPVIRARETAKPRDIRVEILDRDLVVHWHTDSLSTGLLKYHSNVLTSPQVVISNNGEPTATHEVHIPRTNQETEFWIVIFSDGVEYRLDDKELYLQI